MDHGRSRAHLRRPRLSRHRPHPARSRVHRGTARAARGIVLTHGHEDHIGAMPYLAEELKVPLYATPFTAGLIAGKLEEEGLTGAVSSRSSSGAAAIELGPFRVSFVPLAHSIPEGNGLLIETPFGKIFHTGDWKIDETPVLGGGAGYRHADRDRRCRRARARVRFDQRVPGQGVGRARKACIPACCAEVDEGARDASWSPRSRPMRRGWKPSAGSGSRPGGRCVSPGAALERILRVAQATGYLRDFPPPISFDEAMRLPRREVLIIATGGQGEPRAALGRVAFRDARPQAHRRRYRHLLVADHPRQ